MDFQKYLFAVLNERKPTNFLQNMLFGSRFYSSSVEVRYENKTFNKDVSGYKTRGDEPNQVGATSYTYETFIPPVINEEISYNSETLSVKQFGEQELFASAAPSTQQALQNRITQDTAYLAQKIDRTIERQCAELLLEGSVTFENIAGVEIKKYDHSRSSDHTVTVGSSDRWSNSSKNPLEDLEESAKLIHEATGMVADTVIFGSSVGSVLLANDFISKVLQGYNMALNSLDMQVAPGVIRYGKIGSFTFYAYIDQYRDSAKAAQPFIPADSAIVTASMNKSNTQILFAKPDSVEAGAGSIYVNMYNEPDGRSSKLQLLSAPVVHPGLVNSTVHFKTVV